ncbi:hypothetical protein G6675_06080 [Polynucleobacter paneuropaeus]|nr:hypothetical protein [Polynucleobacter paneuropaeus]MBT8600507.1 hypothetical protein [Polynucleobacter paneuropaeus]
MRLKFLFLIFSIVFTQFSYAGIFGPSTYDDCILEGVKSAKTDLAISAVYQACRNKFPEKGGDKFKDCSAVWTGKQFVKGSPEIYSNYQQVSIQDTTIAIFFPKDLKPDGISQIMRSKIEDVKKICPYF